MTVAIGQIVLHGYHVITPGKDGKREPISYPVDWPSLAAGASTSVPVRMEGDRDFVLTHITHNQSDAAGFIPLRVQVADTNGVNLFRDACYINAVSSQNAGQPYRLEKSRLYKRSNTVKVEFSVDA